MKEIQEQIDKLVDEMLDLDEYSKDRYKLLNKVDALKIKLATAATVASAELYASDVESLKQHRINIEGRDSWGPGYVATYKADVDNRKSDDEERLNLYKKDVESVIEHRKMLTKHCVAVEKSNDRIATALETIAGIETRV